jgi:hypothetical protein
LTCSSTCDCTALRVGAMVSSSRMRPVLRARARGCEVRTCPLCTGPGCPRRHLVSPIRWIRARNAGLRRPQKPPLARGRHMQLARLRQPPKPALFGYPDLSVFGRSVYNVVLEVQNRTSLLLARARSTMMKPDFDVGITSTLS